MRLAAHRPHFTSRRQNARRMWKQTTLRRERERERDRLNVTTKEEGVKGGGCDDRCDPNSKFRQERGFPKNHTSDSKSRTYIVAKSNTHKKRKLNLVRPCKQVGRKAIAVYALVLLRKLAAGFLKNGSASERKILGEFFILLLLLWFARWAEELAYSVRVSLRGRECLHVVYTDACVCGFNIHISASTASVRE